MRGEDTRPLGLPAARVRSLCIAMGIVSAVVALLPSQAAQATTRPAHNRQPQGENSLALWRPRARPVHGSTTTRARSVATRGKSRRLRLTHQRRYRVARRPADPAKLVMPEIAEGDGSSVLDVAARFLGRPYRFGAGGTDSFDCSGFVRYVFGTSLGIDLPHSAQEQFGLGDAVTREEMEPGDLVFFGVRRISHVGIFVGDDKFVHAATRPGQVQVDSLADGYYARVFRGARRIEG